MLRITTRILAALAGLALLVLITPHRNPWDMSLFSRASDSNIIIVDLWGSSLHVWPPLLFLIPVIVIAGWFLLDISTRQNLRERLRGKTAATVSLVGLAYLAFTLLPSQRGQEIVINLLLGGAGMVLVLVGVMPLVQRNGERLDGLHASVSRRLVGCPALLFLGAAFAFVLLVANLGTYHLFGRIPHIVDGMVQYFHAKMIVLGQLSVPAPVPEAFFRFTHMISEGRWYSQYPPGHILLLAAGQLVGAPWIVNPLCGALSVVLLYFIGKEIYNEATARLAVLLAALSPFVLLVSSSFMNHASTLLMLELFLLGAVRMIRRPSWPISLLAGLALGCAVAIRPLTAAAVGAPFAIYALVRLFRPSPADGGSGVRLPFALHCLVAAGGLTVPVVLLLLFNQLTNGSPLLFGYEALHGKEHLPGFGRSGFWNEPHTPLRGLTWTLKNFNALNQYLFGLPFPSLLLPLLGLAWIRTRIWDLLLLASATLLAVAYSFYWYQDWALGPRFYYAAAAPWILLTARSITGFGEDSVKRSTAPASASRRRLLTVGLVLSFVYALGVNAPMLAGYYGRNFSDGNRKLFQDIRRDMPDDAVVFVPSPVFPSLFPQNDPLLRKGPIYARDLGPTANRELMRRFPERRFFKVFSFDDYRLVGYPEESHSTSLIFPVVPGEPLVVEAATSQVPLFRNGYWRDQSMGEFGPGWKNHDQLLVTARAPGAELGLYFNASVVERRSVNIHFTMAPSNGVVEIWWNGRKRSRAIDLHAADPIAEQYRLEDVPLQPGVNVLGFRITGKNDRSSGFGLGLDFVELE
jgi:hypothetical protein